MLQIDQFLLLAADDWWQLVSLIIFLALGGLQQLLTGGKQDKKGKPPKRRPAKRPPAPGVAGQPAGQAAPDQADPLRAEVEQFLRKADGNKPEQGRQQPQGRPQPARPIGRERRPAPEAGRQPRRDVRTKQPPRQPRRRPATPVGTQAKTEEVIELREEDIQEHVDRHLSKHDVTEGTRHLGQQVAQADDKLEARLSEKFEHRLGSLQHKEEAPEEEAGQSIAEEVRELLSQPQGMRQLIVANEVLRRPEERW